MVKAVDVEKGTITFDDKASAAVAGRTFPVAKDANILIDGQPSPLSGLPVGAFVNGVQVSTGNVKDMTWTFAQILERASYGVTLYPGDVIGSGTCGTGCFLELNGSKITKDQWLRVGDVVALEIDRLGRLENTVVAS